MREEHIIVSRDGAVLEIRFNRPDKKNAITNAMYGAMADAVAEAQRDDGVRAVLFTASGDFFSAGNDIKDFAAQSTGAFEGPRHVTRFLEEVIQAEKPIVAAVQGHAVGVGTTMLFQCDLVYVAEHARLTVPFIDLGVVPENASSLTMVERLGHARAFALFGLGEPLTGNDAAAWGLANAALPAAEVEPRARVAAQTLASKPPQSMRLTKRLMRDREALLARMREEGEIFAERLKSPEAMQAFSAFLQRR
ncbi:MAG TPA: enoyl-CoA hydratase-related protein [Vitreimonas sp.]|uniref:enoyl-CoA hydratase-related protein n=1 Tax=Vitreimonas sp. TaxID=3069702 RepID=UPI002D614CFD|nr:enoyl-CoA hydratase-related protein [Vitreimonas sp.]HYD89073.1 enoyl-CoA hydratase-related protein [Vitreimonas sp.]